MTDWKVTTLREIIKLHYGKALVGANRKNGSVPVYGSSGITGFHSEALVSEESLIIGRKGSVGSLYKSNIPFYPIDTTYFAKKSEVKCDWNFLWYLLKYLKLERLNFDAVVPGMNRDVFYNEKIFIPESKELQKEIAGVLSSLDGKIELLREENKTLEATAQVIFKEWFVNFNFPNAEGKPYKSSGGKMIDSELGEIPEGWRTGKLSELGGEISDFVANGSFASLKENVTLYDTPNFALFLRNTDLKSNFAQKVFVDEHSYHFLKKTQLHGGEIIISNVGDVGSVYLCPYLDIPMVLGNNVISLRSEYQSYFFTLFTNRIGQFLINTITGGSAQPKFNKTDFRNMKMIIPVHGILSLYESIAWPLYTAVLRNTSQIQTLSTLRDTLLPKLMKGEVRVNPF